MIWLVLGLWWLVRHYLLDWHALAGVACCIALLMWWAIVTEPPRE